MRQTFNDEKKRGERMRKKVKKLIKRAEKLSDGFLVVLNPTDEMIKAAKRWKRKYIYKRTPDKGSSGKS